jgi:hypothetical protein
MGASLLRTDAFSGLRTSFFGQLMEDAYRECNGEFGNFCTEIVLVPLRR